MKKYEGLFILNTAGREEGVKEIVDKVTNELIAAGAKVEAVQKMDKRAFSRVADKRFNSGYYVNIIFEAQPAAVAGLRSRFVLNPDVFRVLVSLAPAPKPEAAAAK